jgi:DNA polymerase-3 subunit alpha
MLSYYTAWLKCYYPREFMVAILNNEGDKDAITDYLIECKRLGIRVLLPHVNKFWG